MVVGREKKDCIVVRVWCCWVVEMGWLMSWKKPCSRQAARISEAAVGEVKEMMGRLGVWTAGTMVKNGDLGDRGIVFMTLWLSGILSITGCD